MVNSNPHDEHHGHVQHLHRVHVALPGLDVNQPYLGDRLGQRCIFDSLLRSIKINLDASIQCLDLNQIHLECLTYCSDCDQITPRMFDP